MNLQQTVPRLRDAIHEMFRKFWRAQLVGLNIRITQLERVREESRPVRTRHSQSDYHLRVDKHLKGMYGERRTLAKRLGISELEAARVCA